MGDLVSDDKAMSEIVENDGKSTDERIFSCHFCDKKFLCPQALGGHQNAHRRQQVALKHHPLHYGPFDQLSMPPSMHVHSPLMDPSNYRSPYHSMDASHYRRPVMHAPDHSTAYALQTQFRGRVVYASTNRYPTRPQAERGYVGSVFVLSKRYSNILARNDNKLL